MSHLGTRCRFADKCPVFNGEEVLSDIPLQLYRNVFCYRGLKGWNNCKKFIDFDNSKKQKGDIKYL